MPAAETVKPTRSDLRVERTEGMFRITRLSTQEQLFIRNLGTNFVELMNYVPVSLSIGSSSGTTTLTGTLCR